MYPHPNDQYRLAVVCVDVIGERIYVHDILRNIINSQEIHELSIHHDGGRKSIERVKVYPTRSGINIIARDRGIIILYSYCIHQSETLILISRYTSARGLFHIFTWTTWQFRFPLFNFLSDQAVTAVSALELFFFFLFFRSFDF